MTTTVAWVQEDSGPAPGTDTPVEPQSPILNMGIWFIAIFAIFYFLLIRPQKRQEREKQAMLSALGKNDRVLTQGGMFGTVTNVTDDEVTLKVDDSNNTRVRIARQAVVAIVSGKKDGEASEKSA
ncbi:MAG: preprotein translocase subunit YajC [Planctomycetota bacterium]